MSTPEGREAQASRAWRDLTRTLGSHTPRKLKTLRALSKDIRAVTRTKPRR